MLKWSDIPKAIPHPKVKHWSIEGFIRMVETFPEKYNMTPEYQRPIVWNAEQCRRYVEYWISGAKIAHILLNERDGVRELVDGQQRFHALTLFCHNQLPVFGGNLLSDFEDQEKLFRKRPVKIGIHRIKNYCDVLRWYLQINDVQGPQHAPHDIQKVRDLLTLHECTERR